MAKINGIQLNIFEEYKLPHIKKWDTYYEGWRPKTGEIARICGICHLKGEDFNDKSKQRSIGTMTGYLVALNDTHAEIICPFLFDRPWCREMHYVAPLISIEPEISFGFDASEFRAKYPI